MGPEGQDRTAASAAAEPRLVSASETSAEGAQGDRVQLARSSAARVLWVVLGSLCVGLGALGAVLPGLPTTPFLILAASCYVRSSPRLYRKLLASRRFGPLIREFRAGRGIPRRARTLALAMMGVFVIILALNLRRLIPGFSSEAYATSYFLAGALILGVIFVMTGYFNTAGITIYGAAIAFTWLTLLVGAVEQEAHELEPAAFPG